MPKIRVRTNKPIAVDSPDHICPRGTAKDNSINLSFNKKLLWLIPASRIRVLDLGCAGGGFVKSILDYGGFAVGIEGSDYSKLRQRAEWANIPGHLFTADITEPFQVLSESEDRKEELLRFNVITAWEVMEHIREESLPAVFSNMDRHLAKRGVVIVSVSTKPDVYKRTHFHQNIKERRWWEGKIEEFGFRQHDDIADYFGRDWVRGADNGLASFNMVMTRTGEEPDFDNKLIVKDPLQNRIKYFFSRQILGRIFP